MNDIKMMENGVAKYRPSNLPKLKVPKRAPDPERTPEGKWRVGEREFETNAAAWRYVDRCENQPVSRAEDTADWIARKIANAE